MKAKRYFTVRPDLPGALSALDGLAQNLRWSWDRPTQDLFASIEPDHWDEWRHDPRRVLAEVTPSRLQNLAEDHQFLQRLGDVKEDLERYLSAPRWYQALSQTPDRARTAEQDRTAALEHTQIAYFSPEFGISEALPQYSGGLGVLAGDHLKSASDLGVPLVGIGLFYRHGYFRQSLSVDGWQQERFPNLDPYALALELCAEHRVELDMAGERLVAQIWRAEVGRVTLYLLDTDLDENPDHLKGITDRLYGGDMEHRLRQEMLLGIGGVRALDEVGEPTSVFHTNEGHAGFLGLERIRVLMERDGLGFDDALHAVRAGAVFTTHTPVPAGIDQFPRDLMERYFGGWAHECGVSMDRLMELGHRPGEDADASFNMAVMGMRLASLRNGVSDLHGEVSRQMFADLWPGIPESETPISHITNGVHGPTWVSREIDTILVDSIGPDWATRPIDGWGEVSDIADTTLWAARSAARERMVEVIRNRLRASAITAGKSPSEVEWIDTAFDPDALTICFARRMATYKRAALLLSQPDRLRALLWDSERPIQFIFAGKAHPADDEGKELIRQLVTFAQDPAVRGRIAFVEDYDMALARSLVQGADVWLNTPIRPMEASGTSGMKSVLNGGLHCSILDGWWSECFVAGSDSPIGIANGWGISSAMGLDDHRRIELEANSLYELLETKLVPEFHDRDNAGIPHRWMTRVKESMRTIGGFVGAHRMVRDYVEHLYLPAARSAENLSAHNWGGARDLADYARRLDESWHRVHVDSVNTDEAVGDLGSSREVQAVVCLGDLDESDVEVQLLTGPVGQSGEITRVTQISMTPGGMVDDDHHRYGAHAQLDSAGRMGVTVRVVPRHRLITNAVDFGNVAWAT